MTKEEKIISCQKYFKELSEVLKESYTVMNSCNKDTSAYLVPNGKESEVTYSSKPELSFRISDHWNWYSNLIKCPDPNYIQCYNKDLPFARKRLEEGKASKPIYGVCVALFRNGQYEVIHGEKFDRKTKEWQWIDGIINNTL